MTNTCLLRSAWVLPLFLSSVALADDAPAGADTGAWIQLFNGRNLDGWFIKCRPDDQDKRYWTVEDGNLTARTLAGSKHHYVWLLTEAEYDDFELRLEVQTYSTTTANSGVQVRSRYDDEDQYVHQWRCRGRL